MDKSLEGKMQSLTNSEALFPRDIWAIGEFYRMSERATWKPGMTDLEVEFLYEASRSVWK